jgi:hypothetical protein
MSFMIARPRKAKVFRFFAILAKLRTQARIYTQTDVLRQRDLIAKTPGATWLGSRLHARRGKIEFRQPTAPPLASRITAKKRPNPSTVALQ